MKEDNLSINLFGLKFNYISSIPRHKISTLIDNLQKMEKSDPDMISIWMTDFYGKCWGQGFFFGKNWAFLTLLLRWLNTFSIITYFFFCENLYIFAMFKLKVYFEKYLSFISEKNVKKKFHQIFNLQSYGAFIDKKIAKNND